MNQTQSALIMALFWLVAGSALQKMTNNQPKNRQAEEENYVQKENIVFRRRRKTEKEKEKIFRKGIDIS